MKSTRCFTLPSWLRIPANASFSLAPLLFKKFYFLFKAIQDEDETRYIRNTIKPGMVAVDVGAFVGYYSDTLLKQVGASGELHCFEPSKKAFKYLLQLFASKKNVFLNQKAVSDRSGSIVFYESTLSPEENKVWLDTFNDTANRITVESLRLDDYFPQGKRVDFVKVDVEAHEHHVLLGMERILKENPKIIILFEFCESAIRRAGENPEKLIEFLESFGFKLYFFSKSGLARIKKEDLITGSNSIEYLNLIAMR